MMLMLPEVRQGIESVEENDLENGYLLRVVSLWPPDAKRLASRRVHPTPSSATSSRFDRADLTNPHSDFSEMLFTAKT